MYKTTAYRFLFPQVIPQCHFSKNPTDHLEVSFSSENVFWKRRLQLKQLGSKQLMPFGTFHVVLVYECVPWMMTLQ